MLKTLKAAAEILQRYKIEGGRSIKFLHLITSYIKLLHHAHQIYPSLSLADIKSKAAICARCIMAPHFTQKWLHMLERKSLLPLVQNHPEVIFKIHYPYLRQGLAIEKRWIILQNHYLFALETFLPAALKNIFLPPGPIIAELDFEDKGRFSIRLCYSSYLAKEGELSLVLYDELQQKWVFGLTFCVSFWQPNSSEIFIGGLQGFHLAHGGKVIKLLTRAMYGLRPKSLLLFVLQTLALKWNVKKIQAVTNDGRRLHPRDKKVMADYDQFWIESGGHLNRDGNFTIPVGFVPRSLDTIASKKRSMYRHRYKMLSEIEIQIQENVSLMIKN